MRDPGTHADLLESPWIQVEELRRRASCCPAASRLQCIAVKTDLLALGKL